MSKDKKGQADTIGPWLKYSNQLIQRGDYLLKQFRYQEAKDSFISASDACMNLLKNINKQDPQKSQIKQKLISCLNKAEVCKKQLQKNFQSSGYQCAQSLFSGLLSLNHNTGASNQATVNSHNKMNSKAQNLNQQDKKQFDQKPTASQANQFIIEKDKISIGWDDIKGLKETKKQIQETIILPSLNPQLFQGIRNPSSGILLYGPPGTGKTMIAKAIASQCNSTFFTISASSLLSKWVGDSEKNLSELFAVARSKSPSVIFFDQIDSILQKRGSGGQNEASRRLKTQFLVQFDGLTSDKKLQLLVLGATNRPFDLDEAALRRFTTRVFIDLPDFEARYQLIKHLLGEKIKYDMSKEDFEQINEKGQGYSCADMTSLVREVAWAPIRQLKSDQVKGMKPQSLRPINIGDFRQGFKKIAPSVGKDTLLLFQDWEKSIRAG